MNINDAAFYSPAYTGGGYLLTSSTTLSSEVLTITLPSVTAVSFDFGGLFGPANNVLVTLSDGFTSAISSPGSVQSTQTLNFFGFTSSSPLTSIQLALPNGPNFNAIDNFAYGTAITPEPTPFGLVVTGLFAVAAPLGRKLRRRVDHT